MTNPLLSTWDTSFALAPFDKISDDDFAPAFEEAWPKVAHADSPDKYCRNSGSPEWVANIQIGCLRADIDRLANTQLVDRIAA